MRKSLLLLSLMLTAGVSLNACKSLDGLLGSDDNQKEAVRPEADTGVIEKQSAEKKETVYEKAPDLSDAEELSFDKGGLSSDLSAGIPPSGIIDMNTDPQRVHEGVSLSDRLAEAPAGSNTSLGSANPYASVQEGGPAENAETLLFDSNAVNNTQGVNSVSDFDTYPEGNDGRCSLRLHSEASGIASGMIRDLTGRMRTEPGFVFIAPTAVSGEYNECINDLAPALKDGLAGNESFVVTSGNTNLNNMVSQNAGSSVMLPGLISQCRAADILYLVTSQVSKKGDKAALTVRVVRTSDGVTVTQGFRRLSM